MAELKRSFKFVVEGIYYGAHGATGLPVVKPYSAEFVLPSQEAALSVIVKHLLKPYLRRKYPDFASVRTHKISRMEHAGRAPDPKVNQMAFEDMEIADLYDFCILNQIFIDPYKHKNLEQCREQIIRLYQSRSDEKKLAKKTGKDIEQKEVSELLKLNGLEAEDEFIPSLGEQRIGAALKNRGDGRVSETTSGDIRQPQAPLEANAPLADAPSVVEEHVNNDPALTAAAFEKAEEVSDIFS